MNELKLGILHRIARGEITPIEGQALLDQFEKDRTSPSWRTAGNIPPRFLERILNSSTKILHHDIVNLLSEKNFKISYAEFRTLITNYILDDYVQELETMGYHLSKDEMVNYVIYGITTEYISDLKASGFTNLSTEDIFRLKIHDMVYDYILQLKSNGYGFSRFESELINGGNDVE